MKELSFSSGVVEYKINGGAVVSFNPADREFVERFYSTFEKMGTLQDEYAKKAETLQEPVEAFSLARERDGEMGKVLDGLFDGPVSEAVFSGMSLCAFADGFPVWMNFMLAVLDEIEANIGDIQRQADPRIAKYKAKYQKYAAKLRK